MRFPDRKILLITLLGVVLGTLAVGLYPFNYRPHNGARVLKNGAGLLFYGRGQAVSTDSTRWPPGGHAGQPFTLEVTLEATRAYDARVPHIVSFCDRSGEEIFYLGQWRNHLVLRLLDRDRWSTRVTEEAGTPDLLFPGKKAFLSFVFSDGRVELFADGLPADVYEGFGLIEEMARRPVSTVILGNSAGGDSPWSGEVLSLSLFTRALDAGTVRQYFDGRDTRGADTRPGEVVRYGFDEARQQVIPNTAGPGWDLTLPDTLDPVRREFLSLPSADNLEKGWFYEDVVVNLAGFVPLGFLLAAWFAAPGRPCRAGAVLLTLVAGFTVSLLIETGQGFLVTRTSSVSDLALNTLGAGLGALVFAAAAGRLFPGRFN